MKTTQSGLATEFNLERFTEAQNPVYAQVCAELRSGHKSSHWMWFIFPQIKGLGSSPMAVRYAISSLEEARAYLEHPLLGVRLRECCELLLEIDGRSIEQIMGYLDDLKLRSSMTLFSKATEENALFLRVLEKYFAGKLDEATTRMLHG